MNSKFTLIGMSHTGKTYWSRKIEREGFKYFHYEEIIKRKLEEDLKKDGFSSIEEALEWMRKPYDVVYKKMIKRYRQLEEESLRGIIREIKSMSDDEKVVIDTTESIIDLNPSLMEDLRQLTKIILLDTPETVQKKMLKTYLSHPKPLYWGKNFRRKLSETYEQALIRCYPKVQEEINKIYKKQADITLNYYLLRAKNFSADNFINIASGNF